jgi:hypothetical protein
VQGAADGLRGAVEPRSEQADERAEPSAASGLLGQDAGLDDEVMRESTHRGQLADEASGSVASAIRTPDEPATDVATADEATVDESEPPLR